MITIKECLLNETPDLNEMVINKITNFVDDYYLEWFPGENDIGVYFLLKDLSKLKSNIQANYSPSTWTNHHHKSLANVYTSVVPTVLKLKGSEAKRLTKLNPSLNLTPNVTNIFICNWTVVYRWFIDPLFSDDIKKNPDFLRHLKEVALRQFVYLSSYTQHPFQQKVPVQDCTSNTATTQYLDLVRDYPETKEVHIYQLICHHMTWIDVIMNLVVKEYLELAKSYFPGRQTHFFFVAKSFSPEASNLLRMLIGSERFITIQQLAQNLKAESLTGRTESDEDESDICYFDVQFEQSFNLSNADPYRQVITA